ncbi:Oidioi.mRNA.OKI2018_I69.chr1.g1267.t1.cds [Oikopleura dioica]|uniref:Oidioi.mRNA.OKI2018_I69.chr1.g1267.t1.cds n=1 Tax=Oikopleura dioica TaxID=34765 RepID=A0ABN7SWL1_OIKDI|nr:Oidioi.mRNA.OKI2018_I69.chr1.g1267.t1.cds [Oikopleura dioica]
MKITPKEISREISQKSTSYENEAVVVIEEPVQVGTDGNRVINRSDMVLAPKGREKNQGRLEFRANSISEKSRRRIERQKSETENYLKKLNEFVECYGRTHNFDGEEFYNFGIFRFGLGKDYIRPCNFVMVRNELDLNPKLHYDYLMRSNPAPGMILSVHGTGISESLDGGYAASLLVKEQIYKAAECTGSWITTSGMNDPLNNLIGSARYEVGRQTGDKVPIIGFPFWEAIKEKNGLKVNPYGKPEEKREEEEEVEVRKEIIMSTNDSSLDRNHSQFMIFEGRTIRTSSNPQRNNFRFHVEMKFKDEGDGIPVANILVSGDLSSLKSIILSWARKLE